MHMRGLSSVNITVAFTIMLQGVQQHASADSLTDVQLACRALWHSPCIWLAGLQGIAPAQQHRSLMHHVHADWLVCGTCKTAIQTCMQK